MAKKVPNTHKVPTRQWKRWSEHARAVFNAVFATMADQGLFSHPKVTQAPASQWRTTRWNAAWVAADAVDAGAGAPAGRPQG